MRVSNSHRRTEAGPCSASQVAACASNRQARSGVEGKRIANLVTKGAASRRCRHYSGNLGAGVSFLGSHLKPIQAGMQEFLRWFGFVMTMGPGLVIAARVRPRLMGWAFVGLTIGSLLWMVAGFLAADYALVAQNVAITLINFFGIYRWLIWKGKI